MDIENLQPFANAMNEKFIQKAKEGYIGWDDPEQCSNDELIKKLYANAVQEDWVDVANIAAILWWRKQNLTKQSSGHDDRCRCWGFPTDCPEFQGGKCRLQCR